MLSDPVIAWLGTHPKDKTKHTLVEGMLPSHRH